MNIAPISSYNNKTSFGMAFKKNPPKEVTKLFADTMRTMQPKERETFVNSVDKLVTRAKECPIEIEHTLVSGYTPHYGAKIGNEIYSYDPQKSTNQANSIIESMETAVKSAEDKYDFNNNMLKLNKILNS